MLMSQWTLNDIPPQIGKRFIITGGNSGIGYFAAVELARRGAVVVLACRDPERGRAALKLLKTDAASPASAAEQAELADLDLASLASVQAFAERELARGLPLDGLINNAGVMAPPKRKVTADGFELQFGTNVLGHFALTCRLMPLLQMPAKARVVTLASIAHKRGSIRFDDLQWERGYSPMMSYAQSKLADLMFAIELERRLKARGSNITSVAAHPGVAETRLFKVGSSEGLAKHAESLIQGTIGTLMNSGPDGALSTLFAATSDKAQPGCYYGPQGFLEMRGGDVGPAKISSAARDTAAQQRLWEICAELTATDLPD